MNRRTAGRLAEVALWAFVLFVLLWQAIYNTANADLPDWPLFTWTAPDEREPNEDGDVLPLALNEISHYLISCEVLTPPDMLDPDVRQVDNPGSRYVSYAATPDVWEFADGQYSCTVSTIDTESQRSAESLPTVFTVDTSGEPPPANAPPAAVSDFCACGDEPEEPGELPPGAVVLYDSRDDHPNGLRDQARTGLNMNNNTGHAWPRSGVLVYYTPGDDDGPPLFETWPMRLSHSEGRVHAEWVRSSDRYGLIHPAELEQGQQYTIRLRTDETTGAWLLSVDDETVAGSNVYGIGHAWGTNYVSGASGEADVIFYDETD